MYGCCFLYLTAEQGQSEVFAVVGMIVYVCLS